MGYFSWLTGSLSTLANPTSTEYIIKNFKTYAFFQGLILLVVLFLA